MNNLAQRLDRLGDRWFITAVIVLCAGLTLLLVRTLLKRPDGCYYVVQQGTNIWRVSALEYSVGGVRFEGRDGATVWVAGTYTVTEYGCR